MATIPQEKVVALPGVQPRTFINGDAADELQKIVDGIRSGDFVGIGYVAIDTDGRSQSNWNIPNKMGSQLFLGIARLYHELMSSGTRWQA